MSYDSEQLTLPIAIHPKNEVSWFNVREVEKRRLFGLFGTKIVKELIQEEDRVWPSTTKIEVEAISKLKDPDLRYALRFKDAADQAGWQPDGAAMQSRHDVSVDATDEGMDSRFMGASYSGVGKGASDTFLLNLYRFAPDPHENH
jgi:hypothetical protein